MKFSGHTGINLYVFKDIWILSRSLVKGVFMAEWLVSLTQNLLSLTIMGLNIARNFGFFHVRKLSSSLRNIGGSTQVQLVPEIMHKRAPLVFLHQ